MVALGGEYAHKQFMKGDVVCSLQWINNEPAICLFPRDVNSTFKGAYVICLSALHKYVDSNGAPTKHMIASSLLIAQQLGFQPGRDICFRLTEIVLDAAEDLVKMPPEPEVLIKANKPESVGEMTLKHGGKIILETEV
jgi:hypothetical protein